MEDKRKKEKVIKKCAECGIQMNFPNWLLKTKKYCSKECSSKSKRKGTKIINCKICNKEIKVPLNNKIKKYCSKRCQDESKRKETIKICVFCKKKFKSKPPHEKRKYCSKRCQGDHLKILYKGEGNPSFKKKYSKEEITKRRNATIKLWEDSSYRENILKKLKTAQDKSIKEFGVSLGWSKESSKKRKETYIKTFEIDHNWKKKTKEERRKCDDTCLERYKKESWEIAREALLNIQETSIELKMQKILEKLNIGFEKQYRIYYETRKYRTYDFYVPCKNLLIEVDGDYWHSNPNFYKLESLTQSQKKNKINDEFKNQLAVLNNKFLVRFWETDIKSNNFERKFLEKYEKI